MSENLTFREAVQKFKDDEQAESLIPLLHDTLLQNALIAWQGVVVTNTYQNQGFAFQGDERALWELLWTGVRFDKNAFSTVAGIKSLDCDSYILRLRGLRLIYPDGTINILAKKLLQSEIQGLLNKRLGVASKKKLQASLETQATARDSSGS